MSRMSVCLSRRCSGRESRSMYLWPSAARFIIYFICPIQKGHSHEIFIIHIEYVVRIRRQRTHTHHTVTVHTWHATRKKSKKISNILVWMALDDARKGCECSRLHIRTGDFCKITIASITAMHALTAQECNIIPCIEWAHPFIYFFYLYVQNSLMTQWFLFSSQPKSLNAGNAGRYFVIYYFLMCRARGIISNMRCLEHGIQ